MVPEEERDSWWQKNWESLNYSFQQTNKLFPKWRWTISARIINICVITECHTRNARKTEKDSFYFGALGRWKFYEIPKTSKKITSKVNSNKASRMHKKMIPTKKKQPSIPQNFFLQICVCWDVQIFQEFVFHFLSYFYLAVRRKEC